MKRRIITGIAAAAVIGSASIWAIAQYDRDRNPTTNDGIVQFAATTTNTNKYAGAVDFSLAAEQTVKSVVHITTKSEAVYKGFYGVQQVPQMGSGSGVVISEDGYIVTNNHVVQGADEVKVTFSNNVSKTAKVIGTDPASDLAVIKVEGSNYPFIVFGNSDDVKLGQWVLAVGYPLNLDATVTAGIVSAKSRNIGINRRNSQYSIESFIQTDAAVNMGNSGGALVNTDGYLIGINSAIATPTGTYAGYSYAIPSNLARKVVNDIIGFGSVQRGFIGAQLIDISRLNEGAAEDLGLPNSVINSDLQGVVVADVVDNGGAQKAGMRRGDIITKVNGMESSNSSQLMEMIAMKNPGDEVNITYIRNNQSYNAVIKLKSQDELYNSNVASDVRSADKGSSSKWNQKNGRSSYYSEDFGFGVGKLDEQERSKYALENGVVVTEVDPQGKLSYMADIKEGFVITNINGKNVDSPEEVQDALNAKKGISITGTYPGTGSKYSFSYR